MTPKRGKQILYLTQKDVVAAGLGPRDVLKLVRTALTQHGLKKVEMPAKIGIHPLPDTLMHAMPAWAPGVKACGIKWAECFPDNYRFKLPQTSGLMVLNDPQTGWPVCIMDAIWITAKRTPAVSALACQKLARRDTTEIGIAGAGVQGREHVQVLPLVLPKLKKIKITDRFPQVARKLVADLQPTLPKVELVPCEKPEQIVRGSQVVVTATAILNKPDPQVRDRWIEPGALLLPVDFDSYWEWKTFKRASKFLVDSLAEMQYFMTVGYLAHGLPKLHAEIGEVIAGVKPGRQPKDDLIIDMNIGMGIEDVVVGLEVYRRACRKGLGRLLPL
ncbi:MAG: Delta(1)-pyrroline-2-carboxylate reductase [Phycisphaerae bacterium]|nr:Delta(1)-pyrroline-2-carboxylate reductase [Phycisphaerae bacterium]